MSTVNNSQELGKILVRIAKNLLSNQNLCRLLKYSDIDPLSPAKQQIEGISILNKNIRIIPLVRQDEQNSESKIVLLFADGESYEENNSFSKVTMKIQIFCPLSEWIMVGETIRPFEIISEIKNSLSGKRINGLGVLSVKGFRLITLTEEMGCYEMECGFNEFS
jgi:hypothetical protein